ncbi:allantoate amidohydrolase [Georgenia sp. Z1491]|uniref:allantoate amidohydrolase n=1 Tax=Georgenia sp. Z1491 TaxID=3416707 RepID=UPI003CEA50B5
MTSVARLLGDIAEIGRDPSRGGYSRPVYSTAERDLRSWFVGEASARGLDVSTDRNGIIWAWWGEPRDGAIVTGSHLDSVPGGGAFDGPLGVASALAAIDELRRRGHTPGRGLAVAVFPEEEGSRFGVACLGSRLLTGAIEPDRARGLTDADGISFAEASAAAGIDPDHLGPDPEALARIGTFVELHVEQGRGLGDDPLGPAIAVATSILGHGRWRLSIAGQGNHAGTTLMADRHDPMVAAARVVLAAREAAAARPDARATIGRVVPVPGGTNVIASRVDMWLDVRHPDDAITAEVVAAISAAAHAAAAEEGCTVDVVEESLSATVDLDPALGRELAGLLPGAARLATGAGHDAGVLAAHVPSGMLFVRNPSGISHAPQEHASDDDAERGGLALADVLVGLEPGA